MGGGLMQLVAYGAQDIYLTGNPQITFFKVVYRRHTNFAMESIQQSWNGSQGFGNSLSATISRNGDLVNKMYLESSIALNAAGDNVQCNPGSAMINNIICEIGGQQIDKHYGHWLEVWAELTEPNPTYHSGTQNNNAAGQRSVGTLFQNMSAMGGVSGQHQSTIANINKFFVPLQFWFCRNPGLALPLIALQYHEVTIKLEMGAAADVAVAAATPTVDLWCDYIYLDTDERRRFAQVSHEYLIEQLQYQTTSAGSVGSYDLNFNHPVKELIWTGGTTTTATEIAGPSTPLLVTDALADSTTTFQLKLNGHDRMAVRNALYFTRQQVHDYHTGCGGIFLTTDAAADALNRGTADSIAVYSFALKPEEHQPSGTCNFSRIDNAQLVIGTAAVTGALNVYAINYNVLRIMSGMGGLAYSN
jgi:hypothetical protein